MRSQLPNPTIAVILAGGKARRFNGQDKGEILIENERLIEIIQSRLKPQADDIIISGMHNYNLGFQVIPDADAAPVGPVGGLYSVWKAMQVRDIEGVFTAAVDGPNLPDNLIASLYHETTSAIAVDEAGRHPTYGWWRMKDLAAAFKVVEREASVSLNRLADLVGAKSVVWEGKTTFVNINQKSDLERFVKGA